jgi:hypothetical protein
MRPENSPTVASDSRDRVNDAILDAAVLLTGGKISTRNPMRDIAVAKGW